jgi:hypothetical protein
MQCLDDPIRMTQIIVLAMIAGGWLMALSLDAVGWIRWPGGRR